jgi:hypothetical protein
MLTDTGFLVKNSKIVGGSETGTRTELTANGLRGYNGTTLQFEVRASDGRAYAGGGAVVLDANGITITGQVLKLYDGANTGYLYENSGVLTLANTGDIRLYPTSNIVDVQAHVLPSVNTYDLGASYLNGAQATSTGCIHTMQHLTTSWQRRLRRPVGHELAGPAPASSAPVGYDGRCYFKHGDLHPMSMITGRGKSLASILIMSLSAEYCLEAHREIISIIAGGERDCERSDGSQMIIFFRQKENTWTRYTHHDKAIVDQEKGEGAIYDSANKAILVFRARIGIAEKFEVLEPDGADKLIWLKRFNLITDEEFVVESAKYAGREEKRLLYEALKREFEEEPKK